MKAATINFKNEVKPMEEDDTEVLTQEDKERIQKEMLEQQQDEEQEEDWVASYLLAINSFGQARTPF